MTKSKEYRSIPTKLSEDEFNKFIFPHLTKGTRGPKPKIPLYRLFNYILLLMHTGCQWYQLNIEKDSAGVPEIHYSRVFRSFKRWVKDGCFEKIFKSTVSVLHARNLLDVSIYHGDGTTTAAKKGAIIEVATVIKRSRAIKLWPYVIVTAMLLHLW